MKLHPDMVAHPGLIIPESAPQPHLGALCGAKLVAAQQLAVAWVPGIGLGCHILVASVLLSLGSFDIRPQGAHAAPEH